MKLNQEKLVKKRESIYTIEDNNILEVIQKSIFGVIYVMLKDDESSLYVSLFLSFTEFLEFLQFPFHSTLWELWNHHIIIIKLNQFIEYLNIVHYIQGQSEFVYLLIFYIFVATIACIILNMIYVSYSFSRNYFTTTVPLIFLRKFSKVFVTVLFMPILELFLSIFICKYDSKTGKQKNIFANEMICYEGVHFIHMIISFVISVFFLIICIVIALNFFECSETTEELEAK